MKVIGFFNGSLLVKKLLPYTISQLVLTMTLWGQKVKSYICRTGKKTEVTLQSFRPETGFKCES